MNKDTKIIWKPIDDLIPYEHNAKEHDEKQIKNIATSLQKYGWQNVVLIDENNVIVYGHGRCLGAKQAGLTEAPTILCTDLTEQERREYRILDNKLTESAWIDEELEFELPELDFSDFDLEFDVDFGEEEKETIEDEAPEVNEETEPICKLGDVWKLGSHRLICGDSTDPAVIDRLMDGVKADMLLTDPPYNVDYTGRTKDALKIQNDKMDNDSFRQFLRDAFASADSVMRAGAVFYIWHADSEGYNFRGACADNNWKVRECLIWNKNSMVLGRQDYQWKHEPCLYGWKDGVSHLWASDRKQTTVLNFDRPIRSDLHPTMKPIGLVAYQIGNNTHEEDAVLDIFGGSGSTLIACEQLNRKCYICELDPKYCDVIIQRWENFTGEKAVRVSE